MDPISLTVIGIVVTALIGLPALYYQRRQTRLAEAAHVTAQLAQIGRVDVKARIRAEKRLRIGIVHYPPFATMLGDEEPSGLYVDLIREFCAIALVEYPARALREPFDEWDVERTTRLQPHSRFANIGRNDPCPCESGKKYKKCCLPEAGVLRPHFDYTFAVKPPDDVPLDEVYIP